MLAVYDRPEGGANGLSQSIPLDASDIQIDMLLNNLDASVFSVSGCGVWVCLHVDGLANQHKLDLLDFVKTYILTINNLRVLILDLERIVFVCYWIL